MYRKPKLMNRSNMISATEFAKHRVAHIIANAKEIENDACADERLFRQLCKACYYSARIGGAAITSQECMCCGEVQQYGSTATDALCKPCATKHSLCKQCGGDIEMRIKRKIWPEPDSNVNGGV